MRSHWWRRTIAYRWYMKAKAIYAWKRFGCNVDGIAFLWVTWTDWKSTTSGAVYHILKQAWVRVGVLSTVFLDVWDGMEHNETHMTSQWHKDFRLLLCRAKKNWITHMVLEVSSHALYQSRIWPITFQSVWITNLTREHLDFHWTMEHYAATKAELFSLVVPDWLSLLPSEFTWKSVFLQSINSSHVETFWSTKDSTIRVTNIIQHPELEFIIHYKWNSSQITSPLIWAFNCDNLMIACAMASHIWVPRERIVSWMNTYTGLPWRQQRIVTTSWVTAMIDFALTPDALKTLYTATREMWYSRLIAIFGATWNRDQWKRPKMGAIAAECCDVVLLTEDENYHEDGMDIMKAVEQWILDLDQARRRPGMTYELVQDRREAIARGLHLAQKWDIIIVTWMADFTSRSMNEWTIPWNEENIIREEMNTLWLVVEEQNVPV